MKPAEIKAVAAQAVAHIERVCAHWLPDGKKAGTEWEIGDRHGTPGKSLKIHLAGAKAGIWSDFTTEDKGGDAVSLVAYIDGVSQAEAARKLADFLGLRVDPQATKTQPAAKPKADRPAAPEWRALMPVPDDAPPPPAAHPKHGKPDRVYHYRDADGRTLGFVMRFEAGGGREKKEFSWQVFAEADGHRKWCWQGFPMPRPLYGLDALADRSAAPVVLCEGEKAAEACWDLMPDAVSLTWPGGSTAADKANFAPLEGRAVILWADADKPGRQAMKTAGNLARKAGAASVQWLNLPALADARNKGELPAGFDAADLLAEGWDAARLAEFMARPDTLLDTKTPTPTPTPTPAPATGDRFTLETDGLYMKKPSKDDEDRKIRLCDPLTVPALGRDDEGGGWAPVLEFRDRDGNRRQEIIPFRNFLGDGTDGVKALADCGLEIEPGRDALDGLKQYIASAHPELRARLLDSTGWHGGAYLLPDGQIGDKGEALIYRGSRRALGVFTPRGTLADWQAQIAALAVGNDRLTFILAASLAGPLLKHCERSSFAIHFSGDSSLGKSGGLFAGGSTWGAPAGTVHSWRSTDNSLEYVAAQHNDGLLILDELKEVDPKQAGAIAYMLGNSKGKNRAHHAGGLREPITWRIAMLSSGEIGLADHMASVGQKTHAGQTVRFIELPADEGAGFGMWSNLHQFTDPAKFTDHIKTAAARYYGTAGRAFVAALAARLGEVPAALRELEARFFAEHVPADAGGQVKRVAGAFALIALAGELAAEWKICPWPPRSAFDASGKMFKVWLSARPTAGNLEEAHILAHVRAVMERNWQARFIDWGRVSETNADLSRMAAVPDALGFRKRAEQWTEENQAFLFYVTRARFEEEFATKGGFKPRRVAAVLRALGILRCDMDSATLKETLPNGDPRSYCIIGRKLWEAVGDA